MKRMASILVMMSMVPLTQAAQQSLMSAAAAAPLTNIAPAGVLLTPEAVLGVMNLPQRQPSANFWRS